MKQVKFLMVALAILMGTMVTSCMDGGSDSSYDAVALVTVDETIYGAVALKTDDGYTLVPTNPEVLKVSATEYVKRAQIGIKWAEGVVFDGDIKKTYKMEIVAPMYGVPTKKYCDQVDSIKTTYPIAKLGEYVTGANGRYLNVAFTFNYATQTQPVAFDLFPVKAENDQLVMKLCQTVGKSDANYSQDHVMSFELPTASAINGLLAAYKGVQEVEGGELVVPANDSITVKVIASGRNDEKLETKTMKIKIIR